MAAEKITKAKTKTTETKRITNKPAPKRLTAKASPKQITTAPSAIQLTSEPEAKKLSTKTPKRIAAKAPAKRIATTKSKQITNKAEKKPLTPVNYDAMSIPACMDCLMKMGIDLSVDELLRMLMEEADLKKLTTQIMKTYQIKKAAYTMKKDGFTSDVISALLSKLAVDLEIKASDYPSILKEISSCVAYQFSDQDEDNADAYLKCFNVMEKLLMLGQKCQLHSISDLSIILKAEDLHPFIECFLTLATQVLPKFQYRDVTFYEEFMYALLSQYDDIYWEYEQRLQMDVADLYIQHHDYQRGDTGYGYLMRENGIRDQIYSRFVKIYEEIDYEKAKSLAYEGLRFTFEESPYYSYLQTVIHS